MAVGLGRLNQDFDLYLAIVGAREKQIGLGTYGDGVNRQRPMPLRPYRESPASEIAGMPFAHAARAEGPPKS